MEHFVIIDETAKIGKNARIRSHTVIYPNNEIGDNFQTGHGVLLRENNKIGDNVSIGSHAVVEHSSKIGNKVRIHSLAFIPEYTILEDRAWIGPKVTITNSKYPNNKFSKEKLSGVTVKEGAKIGANSTILPGITIGKNALVGAGSVVTKDVPEGKVVVGNPAKVAGDINDIEDYKE